MTSTIIQPKSRAVNKINRAVIRSQKQKLCAEIRQTFTNLELFPNQETKNFGNSLINYFCYIFDYRRITIITFATYAEKFIIGARKERLFW